MKTNKDAGMDTVDMKRPRREVTRYKEKCNRGSSIC